MALDKAYDTARDRKRAAESTDALMESLRRDAPDLADQVTEERLQLNPGIGQRDFRAVPAKVPFRFPTRLGRRPLILAAVISEGALHRLFAEPDMAVAQLHHLVSSAQLSNVSLRVLPFKAGLHRSMSGSFTLLEFAPGVSSPIAYQEYAVGGHIVDDQNDVRDLSGVYDQLYSPGSRQQRKPGHDFGAYEAIEEAWWMSREGVRGDGRGTR